MKKSILILIITSIIVFSSYYFLTKEPAAKKYTIAVINYSPAADPALSGLKNGLKNQGFTENIHYNLIYNGFFSDKKELLKEANRLVNLKPDLIYSMTTPATLAVKKAVAGKDIPIVFGPVSSPVRAGIVASMKHTGENITGVTFGPQESRRLEMLTRAAPLIKRVLVPYNPNDKSPQIGLSVMVSVADSLGLKLFPLPISSEQDLLPSLNNFKEDVDAIFITTDSMMVSLNNIISEYAISNELPYSCPNKECVEGGALFSYGFSVEDLGFQAARIVRMVLTGTRATEIPVELSEFKLVINVNTAEKIGIEIPPVLLNRSLIFR